MSHAVIDLNIGVLLVLMQWMMNELERINQHHSNKSINLLVRLVMVGICVAYQLSMLWLVVITAHHSIHLLT